MTTTKDEQPKRLNLTFENTFKLMLRAMDITQFHPFVKKDRKWACKFFLMYITALVLSCVVAYSIIVIDLKGNDIARACLNGILCFTFCVITFQYCVMFYHQKTIQTIINTMNKDYENAEKYSAEEQQIILQYVEKGKFIISIWARISHYGGVFFVTRPIFLMIYYAIFSEFKPVFIYDTVFPDPIEKLKNTLSVYPFLLYLLHVFYICYCVFTFLGFEPLGAIFMVHACGQLEVARSRILQIFHDDNSVEDINRKLKHIAKSLRNIYGFVDNIKISFMIFYELTLKTTIVALPIVIYLILGFLKHGELKAEFICIVAGAVTMSSVPCYYSDLLMETGENLRLAIYSCNWENRWDRTSRTLILLLLLQTTPPVAIRTMFYPLSLDALADVFRQAYTIFNLLNAAYS